MITKVFPLDKPAIMLPDIRLSSRQRLPPPATMKNSRRQIWCYSQVQGNAKGMFTLFLYSDHVWKCGQLFFWPKSRVTFIRSVTQLHKTRIRKNIWNKTVLWLNIGQYVIFLKHFVTSNVTSWQAVFLLNCLANKIVSNLRENLIVFLWTLMTSRQIMYALSAYLPYHIDYFRDNIGR